ncbi:hypothetical protein HDV05_006836 [Chytridiales sp. JEL 0842]|nr:hypothetical protein HDV05_006836 [Chytridiales sp. JEL 0842]
MDPYNPSASDQPFGANVSLDDMEAAEQYVTSETQLAAVDYYAVLNLEKNASEDDIKNSYRRLCMTFHPDKHQSLEDKEAAQRQFQVIQKAYDVLSNSGRRHIYDKYGLGGLETSWEVGTRYTSPDEVREEYERQARQKLEAEAENMIKSKGEIHIGLDATALLDPYEKIPRRRRLRRAVGGNGLLDAIKLPELSQAFVKHSWETRIAPQTDFSIQGNVMARNGVGAGSVVGTLRHVVSPMLWGEITTNISQHPSTTLKVVKNITSDVFSTVSATISTPSMPPPLTFVLGRRLTNATTGYITYRTGDFTLGPWGDPEDVRDRSACALGLVTRGESSQWSVELSLGESASSLGIGYFRLIGWGIRARAGVNIATGTGVGVSLAVDRKVSKHSRIGMGVESSMLGGVSLRLRFMRLGQKFVVPILLTPQLDIQVAVYATLIPLLIAAAVDRLIVEPYRKKSLKERLAKVREENASLLHQRKLEALEAIKLMKDQVARKTELEESKNGLVILQAIYGKLPPSTVPRSAHGWAEGGGRSWRSLFEGDGIGGWTTPSHLQGRGSEVEMPSEKAADRKEEGEQREEEGVKEEEEEEEEKLYIDVRIPVQGLVVNSQLHISGGHSKSQIVGFYDPCLGEPKSLRITYKFQGRLHEVEVDDRGAVAAPLRGKKHIFYPLFVGSLPQN